MAALVGAIFAGILTLIANRDSISDSLDSKSGWRKHLFDVASKNTITMNDIYRIRASLRLDKHRNEQPIFSFNWMSNIMTDFCDQTISEIHKLNLEYTDVNDLRLDSYQSEIARIYCRYLLKHHWEYRQSPLSLILNIKNKFNTFSKLSAIQTIEKVVEQYKMAMQSSKNNNPKCRYYEKVFDLLAKNINTYKNDEFTKKQKKNNGVLYFSASILISSILSLILIFLKVYNISIIKVSDISIIIELFIPSKLLLLVISFIFMISFSTSYILYYCKKKKSGHS